MEVSNLSILGPAFLAGLVVLGSHVLLGRQVLNRGIIFIDLAVAQAAATGALATNLFLHTAGDGLRQLAAGCAALLMVVSLHQLEKRLPHIQEALIGGSFVVLASIAALVVAGDAHGGEHISELANGQILWTTWPDLLWLGLASLLATGMHLAFRGPLAGFYIPFAVAITAAVQVVGVYLVFASLIFPALASGGLTRRAGWLLGVATGIGGYATGLYLSLLFDLPSGPMVVACLATAALVVAVCRCVAARRTIRYNRGR